MYRFDASPSLLRQRLNDIAQRQQALQINMGGLRQLLWLPYADTLCIKEILR